MKEYLYYAGKLIHEGEYKVEIGMEECFLRSLHLNGYDVRRALKYLVWYVDRGKGEEWVS